MHWEHWPEIVTMVVIALGFVSVIGAFIAQGARIDGLHKEIMELIKKMP